MNTPQLVALGINVFTIALVITMAILTRQRRIRNGSDRTSPPSPHHPDTSQGAVAAFASLSAALAGPQPVTPESPGVTLEEVHSDQPILAHRAAHLTIGRNGLKFKALNQGETFGVDATAICNRHDWGSTRTTPPRPHKAPGADCECGFYAVPADVDAWHNLYTVDLLVELSGRVVEHELGYRAEHQRILECRLPRCPYCSQPTEVVLFAQGVATAMGCHRHFGNHPDTVEIPGQIRSSHGYITTTDPATVHVVRLDRFDVEAACPVPIVDD